MTNERLQEIDEAADELGIDRTVYRALVAQAEAEREIDAIEWEG